MSKGTSMACAVVAALGLSAAGVWAQPRNEDLQNVTVVPIECWTRTSTRSVRVGELFSLVLTCAVIETQATTVVPDQTRLDPAVLQIPPFEVVSGTQARDVRTPTQRFFQYEYDVRFLGEMIGTDVQLPGPTITYRVQSRVQGDTAVESREREYILPSQTIRILSLVPAATTDIRDQAPETFREIEGRQFRANVLRVVRWILLGLAAVTAIWALAGLLVRPRAAAVVRPEASSGAVLAAAARELADVQRTRQTAGWTPDLAARALTALRLSASYATGRAVAQTPANGASAGPGQLLVTHGIVRRRPMLVSGSATAEAVAQQIQRSAPGGANPGLDDLKSALERFGGAVYGKAGADESALDDALEQGMRVTGATARQHTWIARLFRHIRGSAAGLREKAWAR